MATKKTINLTFLKPAGPHKLSYRPGETADLDQDLAAKLVTEGYAAETAALKKTEKAEAKAETATAKQTGKETAAK